MGLFDRIKKSLFGQKETEEEKEKKAQEQQEQAEEKEEAAEEVPESTETPEATKEETVETEESVESESAESTEAEETEAEIPVAEENVESKEEAVEEKTEEAEPEPEAETTEDKNVELYEKGLSKTNKGFGARLNAFLAKFRTVDEDFFDDLEELLIESDVGYETSEDLTDQLREEAKLQKAKSRDDLKKVIVQKLVEVYDDNGNLEQEKLAYDPNAKPNVYLFVGVNGAGKTTTVGKLAKRFHDQGKKVLLVAADTFRAGAVEQLVEWGKRVDVEVVRKPEKSDPAAVVFEAVKKAKEEDYDLLLVDTAGRLQNKVNLMNELEKIQRVITRELPDAPHEVLLALDATTGQNALTQAKQFGEVTKVSGIVLTKLDGTARGGIVLAIRNELHLPVKLVGLGEQMDDLRDFNPEEFVYGLFKDLIAQR